MEPIVTWMTNGYLAGDPLATAAFIGFSVVVGIGTLITGAPWT